MRSWSTKDLIALKENIDKKLSHAAIGTILNKTHNSVEKTTQRYRLKDISLEEFKLKLERRDLKPELDKPEEYDTQKIYKRILVFGDMQIPFHHPDSINFLELVYKTYNPDLIVCVGDIVDQYAFSSFDKNPAVDNASREIDVAKKHLHKLTKFLKDVKICKGNHDERLLKKAIKAGIPGSVFKPLNQIYDLPDTWNWNFEWTFNTVLSPVHFVHTYSGGMYGVKSIGMSVVQGHLHAEFKVIYAANPMKLYWDAWTGCLFDKDSHAAAYGQANSNKPILGCLMIINGKPILVPMLLKKGGKWVGNID